jgi:hypothetical protein
VSHDIHARPAIAANAAGDIARSRSHDIHAPNDPGGLTHGIRREEIDAPTGRRCTTAKSPVPRRSTGDLDQACT